MAFSYKTLALLVPSRDIPYHKYIGKVEEVNDLILGTVHILTGETFRTQQNWRFERVNKVE